MGSPNDDEDETHPEQSRFLDLLTELRFPDRYYAYCAAHPKTGPEVSLALQTQALSETGRTFRYDKSEKFYAWRDPKAPEGCELGLNLNLREAHAEWILVFGTPSGHVGGTFAISALLAKRTREPNYRHAPPYPTPDISSSKELRAVLSEGLELYDEVAAAIATRKWT